VHIASVSNAIPLHKTVCSSYVHLSSHPSPRKLAAPFWKGTLPAAFPSEDTLPRALPASALGLGHATALRPGRATAVGTTRASALGMGSGSALGRVRVSFGEGACRSCGHGPASASGIGSALASGCAARTTGNCPGGAGEGCHHPG